MESHLDFPNTVAVCRSATVPLLAVNNLVQRLMPCCFGHVVVMRDRHVAVKILGTEKRQQQDVYVDCAEEDGDTAKSESVSQIQPAPTEQ